MREFFRGWKRKAGCVTLLIACVFAAGWVRSLIDGDVVCGKILGEYFTIRSANGDLQLHHEKKNVSITVASKSVIPRPKPNPLLNMILERTSGRRFPPQKRGADGVDRSEMDVDRSRSLENAPWWQTHRVFDKQFYLGNEQRLKDTKILFGLTTLSWTKSDPPKASFSSPYWAIVLPLTLMSAWLLLSKPRQPKPTAGSQA